MPLYEYQCQGCLEKSEILVRSKDEALCCPKCSGEKLTKLFSTFATAGGAKGHEHGDGGCSCCPAAQTCPSNKGL